jgi:transketolase
MEKDPDIWLIVGDLGYKMFDNIRDRFPGRFINTGAAEQAMMGIAAGLALEGKKPFVYSITTFLLYRPFETIRNYIDHEKIPVRLVAGGRDKDYEHDGFSHWSEDADKVLSIFKNIRALWPQEEGDISLMTRMMVEEDRPWFISLKR